MSLRHILNDDPVPPHNPRRLPSPPSTDPSPEPSFNSDHPRQQQDPPSSSSRRHPSFYTQESTTSPQFLHPQPGPFQSSTRDWDSYSGEWTRDQGRNQQLSRYMSPDPPRPAGPIPDSEPETLSRKRRKNTNDDSSHSPVPPRRVSHPFHL
jgi:DNA helicase INO80